MTSTPFLATREDLELLIGEVWASHVDDIDGLQPAPPHAWLSAAGDRGEPCWSGAVSVTGNWRAMIAVDLADPSARALARGMLGLDESEEIDRGDLGDAVGELANIVGGNVKSLMPGPNDLSLPLVANTLLEGAAGLHPHVILDLAWRDAPVRVRVLALRDSSPRPDSPTEATP